MAHNSRVPRPSRPTEVARLELARLPADTPLDQVFCRACELSAQALAVERVGIWLFIDDRSALRCVNLFERTKREHSAGSVLRVADFPTYFASLDIRKAIPAEIAATESWTAELAPTYLQPLGICSMLDAGIFVNNVMVGVVCHEHVGTTREWTTEARDFAGSIADLLALRIQSAEAREQREAFQTQRDRLSAQAQTAALSHLAAGLAHDFRNLLTVFLGQGEMLARAELPPEARQQALTIVNAAERGLALTRELLDFARPVERPPSVLELGDVTTEFMPTLCAAVGPKHELRFIRPVGLGKVLMDKSQYTRLLLNLVVNAREAMPDGGPIDIGLSPVKLSGDPSYSGRFVLLEVSDRGGGMDETTRRRLFEPFFTTKSKGTGLGLPNVRRVVDRAGGLVRVESAPGQGTTFRVFFPRIGASTGGTAEIVLPPEMRDGDAS